MQQSSLVTKRLSKALTGVYAVQIDWPKYQAEGPSDTGRAINTCIVLSCAGFSRGSFLPELRQGR